MKAHLNPLLQRSEAEADGGEFIGRDPRDLTVAELDAGGCAKKPLLTAIRAKCIDCCCGQPSEVLKCVAMTCQLWPFRMNSNPYRAERVMSDEQKAEMAARLRKAREERDE